MNTIAQLEIKENRLCCKGAWTVSGVEQLVQGLSAIVIPSQADIILDGSEITELDTMGSWVLHGLLQKLRARKKEPQLKGFSERHQSILDLVNAQAGMTQKPPVPKRDTALVALGRKSMELWRETINFLAFVGELSIIALRSIKHLNILQWKLFLNNIDQTGYRALPIVGLLSFLIGVVLAYQIGVQLEAYGANVYIVDLLGISVFREFAPLITAIIVAGRTSSSFTAEIGTMKVHEEIDALRTLGLVPSELLTLPKIAGLAIAMPLLTLWSDIFGVLGGMVMSKDMLGINFHDFLQRLQENVPLSHFMIGIGKAPVFAILIAVVGCYEGFQVSGSADSVGKKTTQSVVLAIFLIIIADAVFSVIFSWMNI